MLKTNPDTLITYDPKFINLFMYMKIFSIPFNNDTFVWNEKTRGILVDFMSLYLYLRFSPRGTTDIFYVEQIVNILLGYTAGNLAGEEKPNKSIEEIAAYALCYPHTRDQLIISTQGRYREEYTASTAGIFSARQESPKPPVSSTSKFTPQQS